MDSLVESAEGGLRERKKAIVKNALVESAYTLFRKRGFIDTSVDDIAEHARVSRRTFFRYFPSKDDVLFLDRRASLETFKMLLEPGDDNEPLFLPLKRAWQAMAKLYVSQSAHVLETQAIIDAHPQLRGRELDADRLWTTAMTKYLIDRLGDTASMRLRARIVASAIMGAARTIVRQWSTERKGNADLVNMTNEALALFEPLVEGLRSSARA